MAVMQRHERQSLIDGWDQDALGNATLAIIGHNTFSEYLALSASALGVGAVRLIRTPYERPGGEAPLLKCSGMGERRERLAEMVRRVGGSRMEYVDAHMKSMPETWFLQNAGFVVDATGRHESRALAVWYAKGNDAGFELLHAHARGFAMVDGKEDPGVFCGSEWAALDPVSSMVAAGAVLDSAKRAIFGKEASARDEVAYEFPNTGEAKDYTGFSALVIGAGALGNFVAPALAELGFRGIDIMDPDSVEETNLNRQVMFYDAVGKPKAEVLAARSAAIARNGAEYKPAVRRFGEGDSVDGYSIVFDCVDNFGTRLDISRACVAGKVPLVSGGTSYSAGQVVAYVPGKTSCPEHVLDLERIAGLQDERRREQRAGCLYQPDPSVIMSNMAVAGMMVNEARRALFPATYGAPVSGMTRYDTEGAARFGTMPLAHCGE